MPARKERALLAFLALRAGSDVSGAGLTRALWGDEPPRSATKTLQTYVSALRRVLPPGTIETTPGGYRLAISPDDVDAHRFEQLLRSASRGRRRRGHAPGRRRHQRGPGALARKPPSRPGRPAHRHGRSGPVWQKCAGRRRSETSRPGWPSASMPSSSATWRLRSRPNPFGSAGGSSSWSRSTGPAASPRPAGLPAPAHVLGEELGLEPGEEARALEAAILAHAPDIGPPLVVARVGPDAVDPDRVGQPGRSRC